MYITKKQILFICLLYIFVGTISAGGLQLPSRKSLLVSSLSGAGLGSAAFAVAKWCNIPGAQTLSNAVNFVLGGALIGGCYSEWSYSKRAELYIKSKEHSAQQDKKKDTERIVTLEKQLSESKVYCSNLESTIQNITNKNNTLKETIKNLEANKKKLEEYNRNLKSDNDTLNARYVIEISNDHHQLTQESYTEKINALNKHVSFKAQELKSSQNKISFLETNNKELNTKIKTLSILKDNAQSAKNLLEKELLSKQNAIKKQGDMINALENDLKKTIEIIDVVSQQERITSVRQMPKFKAEVLGFNFLSQEGKNVYWQIKSQKQNTFFPKNFFE